jgi:hypothetical protein
VDDERVSRFAAKYTTAWCSQRAPNVAAFDGLISESNEGLHLREYERQRS